MFSNSARSMITEEIRSESNGCFSFFKSTGLWAMAACNPHRQCLWDFQSTPHAGSYSGISSSLAWKKKLDWVKSSFRIARLQLLMWHHAATRLRMTCYPPKHLDDGQVAKPPWTAKVYLVDAMNRRLTRVLAVVPKGPEEETTCCRAVPWIKSLLVRV